ncbi:MAG: HAMP domain-containing protein [Betaproteobacteria bacterium]|nr:HAMP domain-containing protein [Betaproteobacteria bacterium]
MTRSDFISKDLPPLTADTGSGSAPSAVRFKLTLRAKGILALIALALFATLVGLLAAQERGRLFITVQELEKIHALEEKLAAVNTSVAHAVLRLQEAYYSPDPQPTYDGIALDIEAIQAGLDGLKPEYAKFAASAARFERDLASMRTTPARGALLDLRMSLHDLVGELDQFTREVRDRKDALSGKYRRIYDAITVIIVTGGLVGVVLFGGVVTLFFTRLAWDIKKLETRALEVVTGYRGPPLEVTRHDEIGNLMESVNRMQSALREHERHQEISRQQHFHQEKMAAIGSLAAGVAHEINNPIAAIHGIAQRISGIRQSHQCPTNDPLCEPELILEQTKRISQITRQLSEIAAPRSAEPQLLDLNAVVRTTCNFIGYDRRFRSVNLVQNLDPQLPAVNIVADHFTQVLMNLLINAADATEGITGRKPTVTVTTAARDGWLHLAVADNGCGMDRETLGQAFDEAYTTKPAGKGTGLGLFICKSLVEQSGGRIELESTPGEGTRALVALPLLSTSVA